MRSLARDWVLEVGDLCRYLLDNRARGAPGEGVTSKALVAPVTEYEGDAADEDKPRKPPPAKESSFYPDSRKGPSQDTPHPKELKDGRWCLERGGLRERRGLR